MTPIIRKIRHKNEVTSPTTIGILFGLLGTANNLYNQKETKQPNIKREKRIINKIENKLMVM